MKKKSTLFITMMILFAVMNSNAQIPTLVKDINFGLSSSVPLKFTDVNGIAFFAADDGVHGIELWRSDGTNNGTYMVRDINPYGSSSPDHLTSRLGELYFSATDSTHGFELWKSGGDSASTGMVKDIILGSGSSNPDYLTYVNNVNDDLFFSADDGVNGYVLWKSNGAATGTINLFTNLINPNNLTNVNGVLYFSADQPGWGIVLCRSDGTIANTYSLPLSFVSYPYSLTNVGGVLFFSADDGIGNGNELWKSYGTAISTSIVKDIYSGTTSSISASANFTNVNGRLYFGADDGIHGITELWKSEGDSSNTTLVKDIYVGSSFGSDPDYLTDVNGTLFFAAEDVATGRELWKSTGDSAGTVRIQDINTGSSDSNPEYITDMSSIGGDCYGNIYFSADNGTTSGGVWRSDGTNFGTVNLGGSVSYAQFLTKVGSKIFFKGYDGTNGNELWAMDCVVGISEYANLNSQISVYPNPASSELRIENAELGIESVEIYDVVGEKILHRSLHENKVVLDVRILPSGIYFVLLIDENGSKVTKKFVKM